MAYQAGYDKAVTFKADGAGGATTLKVTAFSWEEHVQRLVTTHTGSSGYQEAIAGILDATGTVEGNVDAANLWNATAPGITPGVKGTITYDVGGTTKWTAHVMVERVNWKSAVNGLVTYNFNVSLDANTGFTRPAT